MFGINLHGGVVERVTVSRLLPFLVVPRHCDGNSTFCGEVNEEL